METKIDTWEELQDALMNADKARPDDTGWRIYRYLKANYEELGSEAARTLLLCYMKLPCTRPSLLHSCILAVAMKMAEAFPEFRFVPFLRLWNDKGNRLRKEDYERSEKDGKIYSSLFERLAQTYVTALLQRPEERMDTEMHANLVTTARQMGYKGIMPMVAIKMFESEKDGRKLRAVKMIGPKGEELLVDWHIFHSKPWEICGQLYDVLLRQSQKTDRLRAEAVSLSSKTIVEVFPPTTGYVAHIDEGHGHYHIYDALSRHFVAENPILKPQEGHFVQFCPIIPAEDKFKSAVVLDILSQAEGKKNFGMRRLQVTSINAEKEYFSYTIADNKPLHELEQTGIVFFKDAPLRPYAGDTIEAIVFLRRCADGKKRNYVCLMSK